MVRVHPWQPRDMWYKKITIDGVQRDEHRVVAERHLGRKLRRNEVVHHINGNRRDNRVENLAVMDRREHNRLHANSQDLSKFISSMTEWRKTHKERRAVQVDAFTKDGAFVAHYSSIRDAELDGHKNGLISLCIAGKRSSHHGLIWKKSTH